jgi:hypothetical protein
MSATNTSERRDVVKELGTINHEEDAAHAEHGALTSGTLIVTESKMR